MKSRNNTNTYTLKHIYILLLAILLLVCAIFGIHNIRPIPTYTIYQLQENGVKKKIKTLKSLNVAKKEVYKYSNPSKKINASVENEDGKRVAIAYGIVDLKQKQNNTITYYDEHFDKMQSLQPQYGQDALYQDIRSINGKLQIQFQISTSVGLIDFEDASLLNMFDEKEVSSFTHYVVKDGYLYHRITEDLNDKDSVVEVMLRKVPTKFKDGTYYSWDGTYFYSNIESLLKAKVEQKKIKKGFVSYTNSYIFQDISIHTKYRIEELNQYIANTFDKNSVLQNSAQYFFDAQDTYHINALTLFSIACYESNNGMSEQASNKNALFHKQSNRTFDSIEKSIDDFAKNELSKKYLDKNSSAYHGNFLGNKAEGINYAYTGDSYWGEKVSSIYSKIDMALGMKDENIKISKEKGK